jgi:hypothetical protein
VNSEDAEPITRDWMIAVGGEPIIVGARFAFGECQNNHMADLVVRDDGNGRFEFEIETENPDSWIKLPPAETKSKFRRLCEPLGIVLTG